MIKSTTTTTKTKVVHLALILIIGTTLLLSLLPSNVSAQKDCKNPNNNNAACFAPGHDFNLPPVQTDDPKTNAPGQQKPGHIRCGSGTGQDLIIGNSLSNDISILTGDGAGCFVNTSTNLVAGTYPISIVGGDFNGDAVLDLAVANQASNDVSILLGNGDGTFGTAVNYPVGGDGPAPILIGNFN